MLEASDGRYGVGSDRPAWTSALPLARIRMPRPRGGEGRRYARRCSEESVLYGVVQQELETFLARAQERGRPVPRFVARELRAFLHCGVLAHGFVRMHWAACGLDRLVAFSCKGRVFCSSCGGRRMADTAAHLVDRVLPAVPVRQWVLWQLCDRLAYDALLVQEVPGDLRTCRLRLPSPKGTQPQGIAPPRVAPSPSRSPSATR